MFPPMYVLVKNYGGSCEFNYTNIYIYVISK